MINVKVREGEATLGGLMVELRDRAYSLFILMLALPFCTPLPMLGVSMPLGAVIGYLGVRLALGMEPKLPRRLRARPVPPRLLGSVLRAAERLLRWLERFMRPRFEMITLSWPGRAAIGGMIAASSLLLMLPLPIPTSNFFPAVTIVCLAAGLTENDGAVVIVGIAFFVLTLALFGAIAFFGTGIVESIWSGWFA
ncbi:MAG TPA: exopolysaccharide biosynthesis protein [Opitutaceae bacterium]